MSTVSLNGLSHVYENTVSPSVHPFNLFIDDGEFLVLYGPSGSGKSTILRMLHGLEAPKSGTILIDGVDVTHAAVNDRDVTLALESYALYPHMSVRDNLGFALRVDGLPGEQVESVQHQGAPLVGSGSQWRGPGVVDRVEHHRGQSRDGVGVGGQAGGGNGGDDDVGAGAGRAEGGHGAGQAQGGGQLDQPGGALGATGQYLDLVHPRSGQTSHG